MIPEVSWQALFSCPPVVAVIPGLAPGIVAILPHLLLLLLVSVTLVASPRTWWRVLVRCVRYPGQTLVAAALIGLALGAVYVGATLFPAPAPGAAISGNVHGFAVGDRRSSGAHSRDSGPLTTPAVRPLDLLASHPEAKVFAADGTQVFLSLGGRGAASFDLDQAQALWSVRLPGELAAEPVPFRREVEGAPERGLVVPVVMSESGALLVVRDGAIRRIELPSPPQVVCVIDDHVLVALDRELRAIAISEPDSPREAWCVPRPAGRATAMAGDENGSFYLLDTRALRSGRLASGRLETLTPVGSASCGLSVRAGLAYLLETSGGQARLRCVDPAAPQADRWSTTIEASISDRPVIAEFGVIVTTARGFELRDRFCGALRDRVELASPPATAVVAMGLSCFALLQNGSVVRYSPGLERVVWSAMPGRPGPSPLEAPSLVAAGRALVASHSGRTYLLRERESTVQLAWSHAHGGAERSGATRGAQVPLASEVLWRTPLSGAPAGVPVPVQGGWLVARAESDTVRLIHVTEDGKATAAREYRGSLRGMVRHGERLLVALAGLGGRGRLLALDAGRATLESLWEVPLPELGEKNVLAAAENLIVVALAESIRALSVLDGGRRWETDAIEHAEAPLAAGGLVVAVGRDDAGAAIVALGLEDGEVRWRRATAGSVGSASFLEGALWAAVSGAEGAGRVLSLNRTDGSVEWSSETHTDLQGPVSITEDSAVFRAGGKTEVLGPGGEHVGSIELTPSTQAVPAPVVAPGVVVVADGQRVRCIDSATLDPIWETELSAPIHALALDGERVLVTAGSELVALGAEE